MIDHMTIKVADFDRAKAFFDAVFAPLGAGLILMAPPQSGMKAAGYGRGKPTFWVREGVPPPADYQQHIAFTAPSREAVDAFYRAGITAGGKDNGAPGLRPHYHPDYYAAFLLDLDGNNIEAVCHAPEASQP